MAEYRISTTGNVSVLRLTEYGVDRPHDFQRAPTSSRASGTDIVVQWVIEGSIGASIGLKYQNARGSVVIVKQSKITDPNGIRQSGAVFRAP